MSDRHPEPDQQIPAPDEREVDTVSEAPLRETSPKVSPRAWRYSADAWRWNRRLTRRYVNVLLRVRSAGVLPDASRARFRAMGVPNEAIDSTLAAIHTLSDW